MGWGMDRGADSPSEAGTRTLAGVGDKSARGRASISSSSKEQDQQMMSLHQDAVVSGVWTGAVLSVLKRRVHRVERANSREDGAANRPRELVA